MTTQPDWSALHSDAIFTISTHISDDADHARFRSVCTSFRSAAPHRPLLPWLLIDYSAVLDDCWVDLAGNLTPYEDLTEDDLPHLLGDGADKFGGFRLCQFPNTPFSPIHRLPDGTTALAGSSLGWIGCFGNSPGLTLHNPFTSISVDLPDPTGFLYITRLVLSSHPRVPAPPYVAFALNDHSQLIYCRTGDASWTLVQSILLTEMRWIDDIIFHCGSLFIVYQCRLFICDPDSITVSEILPAHPLFADGMRSYLVDSLGDLLLVSIFNPHIECDDLECDDCGVFRLEVFRVELEFNETTSWRFSLTKVDDLGGRSLFLSRNSVSVSVGNTPWCKGNCVYFIPEVDLYRFGVFVFSVKDGKVSEFPAFTGDRVLKWDMLWLTPSLC